MADRVAQVKAMLVEKRLQRERGLKGGGEQSSHAGGGGGGGVDPNEKISSLLQYLDEQENSLNHSFTSDATHESRSKEDKRSLVTLRMDLEEQTRNVEALRKALERQKQREKELLLRHKEEDAERLAAQKKETEEVINRHMAFADQLLHDKELLAQRCTNLAAEIDTIKLQCSQQLKEMQEQHSLHLAKQKQQLEAASKLRQEKWVAEKTKSIKELTVKGLEPEIQRMLQKHKIEIRKLEEDHAERLRTLKEDCNAEADERLRRLRERSAVEREEAIAAERDACSTRLKDQYRKLEEQFQNQVARWKADLAMEREKLEAIRQQDQHQFDMKLRKLQTEAEKREDELNRVHAELVREMEKKHHEEMSQLRGKLAQDQKAWKDSYVEETRAQLEEKERVLREKLTRERDAEIEVVIVRLGEENELAQKTVMLRFQEEIESLREQHAAEIRQLKAQGNEWAEKFTSLSQKHSDLNQLVANLNAQINDLELELHSKDGHAKRLERTISELRLDIQQRQRETNLLQSDAASELQANRDQFEMQINSLNSRIASMQVEHDEQLRDIKDHEVAELNQLENRVRKTIARKDEQIAALRDQVEVSELQIRKLEQLLHQQREELSRSLAS
eukprot:GILK01008631.1.p1 GENE.GILK01008631.1~~GILK01008631.1.p1  ORF type:complete len:651 (+),score=187.86 GILK01008631.1:96-1955(+)